MRIVLQARPFKGFPFVNKCMLAIVPFPASGSAFEHFGLRMTALSDRAYYPTVDRLCDFLNACQVLDAPRLSALRTALDNGGEFETEISEESARCMGFMLPGEG
jgi:hypothetical protein